MIAVLRWIRSKYPRLMGISRRPDHHVSPLRRLPELANWTDCWVAVKDDKVIAAAPTSGALAYKLREMGPRAIGAVMQFVQPDPDGYVVGAG